MTFFIVYLIGVPVFSAASHVLADKIDMRTHAWVGILWPLSVPFIATHFTLGTLMKRYK